MRIIKSADHFQLACQYVNHDKLPSEPHNTMRREGQGSPVPNGPPDALSMVIQHKGSCLNGPQALHSNPVNPASMRTTKEEGGGGGGGGVGVHRITQGEKGPVLKS